MKRMYADKIIDTENEERKSEIESGSLPEPDGK